MKDEIKELKEEELEKVTGGVFIAGGKDEGGADNNNQGIQEGQGTQEYGQGSNVEEVVVDNGNYNGFKPGGKAVC